LVIRLREALGGVAALQRACCEMFTAFAERVALGDRHRGVASASLVSASVPASATGARAGRHGLERIDRSGQHLVLDLDEVEGPRPIDGSSAATAATGWPMNTTRSIPRTGVGARPAPSSSDAGCPWR